MSLTTVNTTKIILQRISVVEVTMHDEDNKVFLNVSRAE